MVHAIAALHPVAAFQVHLEGLHKGVLLAREAWVPLVATLAGRRTQAECCHPVHELLASGICEPACMHASTSAALPGVCAFFNACFNAWSPISAAGMGSDSDNTKQPCHTHASIPHMQAGPHRRRSQAAAKRLHLW